MSWKDYEIYIHKHFKRLFPDAKISHNVSRTGIISKTKRQIDILVEGEIAGFDISIIIDCKYFSRKVDVKHVESFISFLKDLKASKGILITNKGYSKAAFNRATYDTQDIELRIIDFKDLDSFQGFWVFGIRRWALRFRFSTTWLGDRCQPAKLYTCSNISCWPLFQRSNGPDWTNLFELYQEGKENSRLGGSNKITRRQYFKNVSKCNN